MPTYQLNLFQLICLFSFQGGLCIFGCFGFAVHVCPNEWLVLFLLICFLFIWNKISKILKI